jgi:hypothetical protein
MDPSILKKIGRVIEGNGRANQGAKNRVRMVKVKQVKGIA